MVRRSAAALAIAAIASVLWAAGCNGLSGDCELNLTCATSTTTTTTTTTPPPECGDIYPVGDCDVCAEAHCCQELADCKADNTCLDCFFGVWPPPPECTAGKTPDRLSALNTCLAKHCSPTCDAKDACNPVTNAPCPSDGTACDAVYPGMFACLPPLGTPAKLCETCDNLQGPFCDASERCHEASKKCARYCCTDADCGTGKCVLDPAVVFGQPIVMTGDQVGLCLDMTGAAPACDAPAMAASSGACVAGYPGM